MNNLPFSPGPYERVGMTIVGARVQRTDTDGNPVPGKYTQPALVELLVPTNNAGDLEGNAELFRRAPETLAERNELAQHLRSAVDYIEHGEAKRRDMADLARLRDLLDREVRLNGPMRLSLGAGASEAKFDITAARTALAHVERNHGPDLPSYAQLVEIAGRLAEQLDRNAEDQLARDPRSAAASSQAQLVRNAFEVLSRTNYSAAKPLAEPDNVPGSSLSP
ncbi:hypothetical protein LMG667_04695 [Xanthomonas euvesicatoria]|uniref:hypothetical protein n=1 Tax=Xanthomonas euvesicatoria TaxID=456327 RepID=UPI00080E9CCC|nr:hypothetical protein [Xanthomonas euvesicatoria]OCG89384.1 hypothetical protein LMG667_04695 [Xanthomonas euvesicatoria]